MKSEKSPFKDIMLVWGLAAIAMSAIFFLTTGKITETHPEAGINIFFINYFLTISYTIGLFIAAFRRHRWRFFKSRIHYTVLMLCLWFISAFSLNRNVNVFDESTQWLSVLVIISFFSILSTLILQQLPPLLRHLLHVFLGLSFMLFIYYSFILLPFFLISIPGMLALGISLHSFVPLALTIITLIIFIRNAKRNRSLAFSFGLGIIIAIVSVGLFLSAWKDIEQRITKAVNQNTLSQSKLPGWVVVSQSTPKTFVGERYLKAGLVYKTFEESDNWLWQGLPQHSFDEPKKHDPFVVLAALFMHRPQMDEVDRIKILETLYNSRHQTLERLWRGTRLRTSNVVSNVKIYPEFRLAYTEKIVTVRNTMDRSVRTPQEAIYTFYLPDGSTVSSLSLWVNGKEEKGILTTKSKADSAYKQIVGVEKRDPSVIHWQEGNTVSVRVFPCTPQEDRKFKIGVTSPLRKSGDSLVYQNIWFDGPPAKNASEIVQLAYSPTVKGVNPGRNWQSVKENTWQLNRAYMPYWEESISAPALSDDHFSFDKESYAVHEYHPQLIPFSPSAIYLDLNSSWTDEEFNTLWASISNSPVFVYEGGMTPLTAANKDTVFQRMKKFSFSLFPFNKIKNPENVLVISKSGEFSPNLNDLQHSDFGRDMQLWLSERKSIRFYAINNEVSPYLKALKELRAFSYSGDSLHTLTSWLSQGKFPQQPENDSVVYISSADILVKKMDSLAAGDAPDHLMRLYAYNQLMRKVSEGYFSGDYIRQEDIALAEKAHIVSPLSSLIVLETQADYERFNIEQNKNSLKNASMNSAGAVPEPHEWMMIMAAAVLIIYLMRKPSAIRRLTSNFNPN